MLSFCRVWSAAVDALTAFVRRFVSCEDGILLQPVLANLRRYDILMLHTIFFVCL